MRLTQWKLQQTAGRQLVQREIRHTGTPGQGLERVYAAYSAL